MKMAKGRKISDESVEQTHLSRSRKMMMAPLLLENITLSPEFIANLQLVDAGAISKKEAIARVFACVKK
jgi:hypothetical protein